MNKNNIQKPERRRVLDTPVDCVDMSKALKFVEQSVNGPSKRRRQELLQLKRLLEQNTSTPKIRTAGNISAPLLSKRIPSHGGISVPLARGSRKLFLLPPVASNCRVRSTAKLEKLRQKLANTAPTPGVILAVNPEKVFLLRQDPALKEFFEEASLLIPDGIGVVKALDMLHGIKIRRCPGADLMQAICREAPEKGYRIFIYGSSETVNKAACEILQQRYPGIQIVGRSNGYVKPEEMTQLIDRINASEADILFVAMGSPKQEKWMSEYLPRLTTVKIAQGIGGTLDTITGVVKRAPMIMQTLNLEWFYRFLCQPGRYRRQIRCFKFAYEVCAKKYMEK